MSVDYRTRDEVVRQAREFREKHNALDWSARIDDLIELHGYTTGYYRPLDLPSGLRRQISGVQKKVRAVVSVREQVILIAPDIYAAQEPFTKGHELGHGVLSWHREILYVCDEHDLSPGTRAQLEYEANAFSSEVLLPAMLLRSIYAEYPISMETVLQLKQLSGASIEMCAHAYVRNSPDKCVLLVLEQYADKAGQTAGLKVVRKAVSPSAAHDHIGTLERDQCFSTQHVLFTISRIPHRVTTTQVTLENSQTILQVSVFNNGYRVLALAY